MDSPWKDAQHYCPNCDAFVEEEGLCEDCEDEAEFSEAA